MSKTFSHAIRRGMRRNKRHAPTCNQPDEFLQDKLVTPKVAQSAYPPPVEPQDESTGFLDDVSNIGTGTPAQDERTFTANSFEAPPVSNSWDKSFSGCNLDEVLVLEILAGTGRLTRSVRDAGMASIACTVSARCLL